MDLKLEQYKDKILFVPLGGAGEIGMNLYLYRYKDKWLMIDLGIGFSSNSLPGIEITVPDVSFIRKHIKNNLVGIVLTHAHEDHLGGIQYLWEELNSPTIYATDFTKEVLKGKLTEVGILQEVELKELPYNGKIKIGPFELETIGITHSIPEMQGILIHTSLGTIFHTGDWKLDPSPVIGNTTDENRLEEIGNNGILALVGDSTNIFAEGYSGSEEDVFKSITKLIAGHKKGAIVVTTFASNIARMYSIIKAADKCGRTVAMMGRSLWKLYYAAKSCGYLDDLPNIITDKEIPKHDRSKLLILATGCQGEEFAAMNKIANKSNHSISLGKDDLVIFSSKIIPGNEKRIASIFNKLALQKTKVFTERDHFVHVSGHPSRGEVQKMYNLIKPKIAIPIHGEATHIQEHAEFALQHGAQQSIEPYNGNVIAIDSEKAEVVARVPYGVLAIDGNFLIESDSPILQMRSKMRDHGLIAVTLIMNKKGKMLKHPTIMAPGIFDKKQDKALLSSLVELLYESVHSLNIKGIAPNKIEKTVYKIIKNFVYEEAGKNPQILVQVEIL